MIDVIIDVISCNAFVVLASRCKRRRKRPERRNEMEQFEQLLTCAICLDRYRNPKLLPCQHSFCMEPCMDGLVDYVRRQARTILHWAFVDFFFFNLLNDSMIGEMSRMPGGTSDTVQRRPGISDKCYATAFLGIAYRNYGRTAGPDQRTSDETLWCVFGEIVRHVVCSLRERRVRRLQRCPYGHITTRNRPDK